MYCVRLSPTNMHVINFSHQRFFLLPLLFAIPRGPALQNVQHTAASTCGTKRGVQSEQGVRDSRRNWMQPPNVDWFVTGLYWLSSPTESSCGGGAWDEQCELHWVGGEEKRGTQLLFPQLWWLFYKLSQKVFLISRRWTMMLFNLMVVVLEGTWIYCQIYSLSPLSTWS